MPDQDWSLREIMKGGGPLVPPGSLEDPNAGMDVRDLPKGAALYPQSLDAILAAVPGVAGMGAQMLPGAGPLMTAGRVAAPGIAELISQILQGRGLDFEKMGTEMVLGGAPMAAGRAAPGAIAGTGRKLVTNAIHAASPVSSTDDIASNLARSLPAANPVSDAPRMAAVAERMGANLKPNPNIPGPTGLPDMVTPAHATELAENAKLLRRLANANPKQQRALLLTWPHLQPLIQAAGGGSSPQALMNIADEVEALGVALSRVAQTGGKDTARINMGRALAAGGAATYATGSPVVGGLTTLGAGVWGSAPSTRFKLGQNLTNLGTNPKLRPGVELAGRAAITGAQAATAQPRRRQLQK